MMTNKSLAGNNDLHQEIIQWGSNYLSSHGYTLKSNLPEDVQHTPWSYVVRFVTSDGYVYLKHTPSLLSLEATITKILHDQFHASVPEVIAHNIKLDCFLMKDAGRPLREILKKRFDATLLCKAVDQFTSLQLVVADHVNIFLDIGVPDWRLDKLPELFKRLLSKKDILITDGLSEIEINKLEMLLPIISHLCVTLFDYAINPTITQPDFHDNNLLIDVKTQQITMIDLGEVVISHPFFSLTTCLWQTKKHHALTDNDDAYTQIMNACLENYRNVESESRLLEAFEIAKILWFVYGALANDRLMKACGKGELMSYQPGKLSGELRKLMAACAGLNV